MPTSFSLPPLPPIPGVDNNLFTQNLAPGGTQGHWDYPDYASLLQKWMQPYQQQYQGEIAAQRAQAETNAKIAQERYGQGPTSTLARIGKAEEYAKYQNAQNAELAQHEHERNLMSLTNALASRGMLSSGERGYQQGEEAFRYGHLTDAQKQAYGQQQYGFQTQKADAENQLLDYLRGVQQAFADAQRQGLSGLAQQQQGIAETLSQIYRPSWVDETPPPPTTAWGAPGYGAGPGYGSDGLPAVSPLYPSTEPWNYIDPAWGPGNEPGGFTAAPGVVPVTPSPYNFPTPNTVPIREIPEGW